MNKGIGLSDKLPNMKTFRPKAPKRYLVQVVCLVVRRKQMEKHSFPFNIRDTRRFLFLLRFSCLLRGNSFYRFIHR